jgi:hypothetical protein
MASARRSAGLLQARDPSKPYPWAGRACRSLEEAVNTVKRASANDNIRDIYVCMSTQRSPGKEKVDKRGRAWYTPMRGQANAVATKTLYVDCDFKGGEHGYDTKEEALQELKRFLEETSLPKPSIVVLSGGGMHIYWSVSRALTLSEWQPLANALAEATKHHNFKCDVGCTVDGARVLRVPGTQNYKQDTPRPVTLAGTKDFDYNVEALAKALAPYKTAIATKAQQVAIELPPVPPNILEKFAGFDNDLSAGIESSFPPIKLADIAVECAFIRDAITTGGAAYTEPMWNLTTLISTFTEGGRADARPNIRVTPRKARMSATIAKSGKKRSKGWVGQAVQRSARPAARHAGAASTSARVRLPCILRGRPPRRSRSSPRTITALIHCVSPACP